jgi:hypothetical protein
MSVYIDDARIQYGRMKMCHMIADTLEELTGMASKIGVDLRWIQGEGIIQHYDLSLTKRKLAIEAGAIEVSTRQLVEIIKEIRLKR